MEGRSSVGCASQVGLDAAGLGLHHQRSRHRSHSSSRSQRHQDNHHQQQKVLSRSSSLQYLDAETGDVLSQDDYYLEDEETGDNMTPDSLSSLHAHRRTASPADSSGNKKSNKPLMEKKRRQRINRCLNDLKTLVLEAMKKDPSRYSKLEKADILEMTVKHLQMLHRHDAVTGRLMGGGRFINGDELSKYRAGFAQCAAEVTKYLATMNDVPLDLHTKVLTHLNSVATAVTANVNSNATCIQNNVNVLPNPPQIILVVNNATPAAVPVSQVSTQPINFQDSAGNSLGAQPNFTVITAPRTQGISAPLQQPQTNNVQILPARLNNGDLAFILPATLPLVTQNKEVRAQPSASLQASAPVLTAILTSDRNHVSSSTFVQPPALSTASDDSALGPETLDLSDSDMSSGVSTPISSMSTASSPIPAEEAGRVSPKKASSSRSSSPPKSQLWASSYFREELNSSACSSQSQSNMRRHSVIAPKPSFPWPSIPSSSDPHKRKKANTPPPPEEDPQSVWRPWH